MLGGAFDAIAQEMAGVLFRMSYSSIIRESEDLGAGLFDPDGRELCESESTPMHIGSLPWYIRGFLQRIKKEELKEGDVIIHNHPYLGASHTPDIAVAVPILWEGELIGFAAVTAHVLDVGGSYPGINADSFDMYAESKIYNGLKWYDEGVLNEDLDRMVFDNVRTETMNRGDMNAMMAACILGRDRFYRLLEKYGPDVCMSSAYDWMDYSEKRLRAEISKLPDGEYVAPTAWLDDDGRNRDVRLRVETKIIVQGDHITIDLTGSNAEVPTGYNVPFEGSLLVGAYFAIRTLLLDQDRLDEPVPQNDGIFRCVTVIAPKGTIFNPNFPRACFSRFCQVQRVVDNTIVALSVVVPDLVTAGNSAALHFCSYAGLHPREGRVLALSRGRRGQLRRPQGPRRDGLRRLPHGEHAQQPHRGARHALPDALRPLRVARRSGGARPVARRHRHRAQEPLPRARRVLLRGRPPHRPAAWHLRRLRRPAGQVDVHRQGRQRARHPGQGDRLPVRRRRDHPAHRAELRRLRQPARPRAAAWCSRTCSTTSRRSSWRARPTAS